MSCQHLTHCVPNLNQHVPNFFSILHIFYIISGLLHAQCIADMLRDYKGNVHRDEQNHAVYEFGK